jgi:NADH-ubiquinone oxidoreductase chain 5
MYITSIFLSLWGSLMLGFFGGKLGVKGSQLISIISITITTLLVIIIFLEVNTNHIPVSLYLFKWIDSELLYISWSFNFDSLSTSMLIPVLIVSNLVHIYSVSYMENDPHNQRFFSYLSLFTFMMIILVTSNNYLVMFVGWEGVGVCSYLLVSFWYTRIAANQSSLAAFLCNRIGDCLLTIGLFIIILSTGNLDYNILFSISAYVNENLLFFICLCLLIGTISKSSQLILHIWLPMAMEGPTPVSALIHAATMVTAGVYLLIRSSCVLEFSSTILLICFWLGSITTLSSSLIGLFQQDIKKIIAYSTMSQLGMMVVAIGLSSYNVALFHLINHAFYKALLFLGAGSIIHGFNDIQDLRKYGGLKRYLPLTYSIMLIASLSLIALPFMSGYYSKDFIIESSYGKYNFSSISIYIITLIGATLTTLYSVKITYLTFLSKPNGSWVDYNKVHEGNIFMTLPLIILALFSIYFGYIFKDMYIGLGTDLFSDNSIYINTLNEISIETEFYSSTVIKIIPFLLTLFSTLCWIYYKESEYGQISYKYKYIYIQSFNAFSYFNQRLFIELFYNKFISEKILKIGGVTSKLLDKGSIEYIGPAGLELLLTFSSITLKKLDRGVLSDYTIAILLGLFFDIILWYNYMINELLVVILLSMLLYLLKK